MADDFTPAQLRRIQQMILSVTTDAQKGRYAGFGNPQNDTFAADDNVDATHPLNVRYIIPGNSQRLIAARLSFHLAAYRTYTSAANNPSVTTSGGSSHSHTVANHSHTTPDHNHKIATWQASMVGGGAQFTDEYQAKNGSSTPFSVGVWASSASQDWYADTASGNATSGSGGGQTSSADSTHTHTVTSNVTLTNGVVEAGTASGVSIAFDGTDKTSALGGPWSSDVVEMDVLKYIQQTPDKAYHTIALTPAGLGRIEAHLRLSYFADASIP